MARDNVQTTYEAKISKGYAGMIADASQYKADSYRAEGGSIPWGIVVQQGTGDDQAVIGAGNAALGIVVRDLFRQSADADDREEGKYLEKEPMPVMREGRALASINGTGAKGASLTYIVSTGQLSTAVADGTHIALNAVLKETVTVTNQIAEVAINVL